MRMTSARESPITQLLGRMQAGDTDARDALFQATYAELRRLARARLRDSGRDYTLETTSLVHESYLRFMNAGELKFDDRRAFFAYASRVMRSVVVDAVRERLAQRRGGNERPLTLSTELIEGLDGSEGAILKVDEALEVLTKTNERLARVVEMRYFGGYSEREIADALGVTERTVLRDWTKARLILAEALR
jgi:RNA polymerase sigma factor (TIGR02999 family)